MSTTPALVEQLRHHLCTATDLQTPAVFFFDHLGMSDAATGPEEQHPRLETIVRTTVAARLPDAAIADVLVTRAPNTKLLHGMALVPGTLCAFFYFEDDDVGLVVLQPYAAGARTQYLRISTFEADEGGVPAPGPGRFAPS